jgi:serine/threonine protein kinase
MSLTPGQRLGPYEVSALIGEGAMGQVYRARDARLNRDVAIKTSKISFDERFQREARAIASACKNASWWPRLARARAQGKHLGRHRPFCDAGA